MDLSALGIPLEPVRDVWLIAFMAYTFACLLVDIAYPVNIPAAKAQELFVAVKGDPVEGAKIRVEDMARNGLPLSSSQKGWVTKRAKKQLESISGSGIVGGWVHVLMYLWAWMVMVSTFTLYWDMAYDGILLPALVLPFLMVYAGARWGRRSWRTARGFSADERTLGMPRIYSATLGRLSAPFRVKGAVPGIGPIHLDRVGFWVLPLRWLRLDAPGNRCGARTPDRVGTGAQLYSVQPRFLRDRPRVVAREDPRVLDAQGVPGAPEQPGRN